MRFIFGFVIGALVVIGAAYIHDASIDPVKDPTAHAMVNWQVVSDNMRGLNDWLHDQWAWLSGQLHRPG